MEALNEAIAVPEITPRRTTMRSLRSRAMNARLLLLILASVSLSALAQVVLKMGLSSPQVVRALRDATPLETALAVATDLRVLGGLALYFASAALWLFVLARLPVSAAYPFVGLGFVLTMLLGWLVLHEQLEPMRVLGTLLVGLGVVLIARGQAASP